jgi:hypothetical protein
VFIGTLEEDIAGAKILVVIDVYRVARRQRVEYFLLVLRGRHDCTRAQIFNFKKAKILM